MRIDCDRKEPARRPCRPACTGGVTEAVGGDATLQQMAQLERARAYIDAHLMEPMPADRIAEFVGVSRSSLYRLFAVEGGVARYIWRMRLSRAYSCLLRREETKVASVAFRFGFRSEAHFSRAFRRRYGVSPSAARWPLPSVDGAPSGKLSAGPSAADPAPDASSDPGPVGPSLPAPPLVDDGPLARPAGVPG